MTTVERIDLIRDKICRIGDVALSIDVSWLCLIAERQITELANIKKECEVRQEVEFRLRAKLEEVQAQVRRLEKERDELRERITSAVNALRDADESEMEPDTWAAVIVAIDTLEGKQC